MDAVNQSGGGETSAPETGKSEAAAPAPAAPAKKSAADKLYRPEYNLVISTSPHDFHQGSVTRIMWSVVAALLPTTLMALYYFRFRAAWMILACVAAAMVTELAMNKMRKRSITLVDGSAVLTGLLLALTLPPTLPLYQGALGAVFAIVIGKHIYGGLGYNIFNPALLGRAFLQISFATPMTTWIQPATITGNLDAITAATPLGKFKFEHALTDLAPMFWGNTGGSLGETSAIAIIAGGLFLLVMKYADWRIPASMLGTVALFSGALHLINPEAYPAPLFMLFSGGLMLGAFFMATDMVTSPITPLGAWIFGIGIGIILVIIRIFGGLPEGVMFSILLLNAFVPLINRYTRPKYLGEGEAA